MSRLDNLDHVDDTGAPIKKGSALDRLDGDETPERAWGDYAKDLVSAPAAIQSGLVKAATFGNFDPSKDLPGDSKLMYAQGAEENPGIKRGAEITGAVGMGGALGVPLGAATKALGLASPASSLLEGAGKALGRIGVNTVAGAGQSYITKPQEGETREGNALFGGALSGGLSTVGEVVSALATPAARIRENLKMQKNPETWANYSRGKMGEASDALLGGEKQNAGKLEELLRGKQIPYEGANWEGNELNALKKSYSKDARIPAGGMWSPGETAKAAEAGQQAKAIKSAIETAEPGAKPLNQEMQRQIKLQSWLRKSQNTAPATTLTSNNANKRALIEEAARLGGTDLNQVASDSRIANALMFKLSDVTHPWYVPGKLAARAGMAVAAPAAGPAELLKDPATLSALLNSIQTRSK